MKALSRKLKKHVSYRPEQPVGGGQDDVKKSYASFKPIGSPNVQGFITPNSSSSISKTPPNTREKILSEKNDSSASPLQDRKNNSCPVSAMSSPLVPRQLRLAEDLMNTNGLEQTKGTSFGSAKQLHNFSEKNLSTVNSVFSFTDFASSVPGDSRSSSLSSLSVNDSPTESNLFLSNTSAQFHLSLSEEQFKNTKEINNLSQKDSPDNINNNNNTTIWKKLPFYRKDKEKNLKKQTSKDDLHPGLGSRGFSIEVEDLNQASEILEKFKEENEALEIEVRGKDEEVRMLNATIDQVNQTWENKVQAMMRDLEDEKRKNEHLRAILSKETAAAQAAKKSTLRIPFDQSKRNRVASLVNDYHITRNSTNKDMFPPHTSSERIASPLSPRVKRKGIRETHRRTEVTIRAKNDDVKQKLVQALMSSACLSQLSRDDLVSIADVMNTKRINKGERLMQEGLLGQAFYILAEGDCRIYKRNQESVSPNLSEGGRPVKQWEIFGDADVFYHTRRVWSCKCVRPGTVYYITRDEFRASIMQQDIQRLRKEIMLFLKQVKSLSNLKAIEFRMLANVSRIVQYANGDYIIRQGSSSNSVHILKEGEVTVTKIIDGSETRLETLSTGQILGSSLLSSRHQNNVVASGKEIVQCVAIPTKHFDKIRDRITLPSSDVTATKVTASLARRDLLGDGQDSLSSGHTGSASSGYGSDSSSPNLRRRRNRKRYDENHATNFGQKSSLLSNKSIEDFDIITTIGNGAFGTVSLVNLKGGQTNVFAIKKIAKYDVVMAEQQQNVFSEKNIQMASSRDCPFIASLYSTLKDNKYVYFVMEFCQGGELFSLLSQSNLSETKARFYASCVLEALAYLHAKHVVFRDLKPENVVIDKDGYCKLTDFGFAKKVSAKSSFRTYTYCGTPEYMAPETILYQAQSFSVDIWSFGVFVYELLDGKAPFRNNNRVALADSILAGIDPVLKMARDSCRIGRVPCSLIRELCRTRPEDRLGVGRNGIAEVAKHAWFNEMDWDALRKRKLTPPWRPTLGNERDLRYFNSVSKSRHTIDAMEELSGWDESF